MKINLFNKQLRIKKILKQNVANKCDDVYEEGKLSYFSNKIFFVFRKLLKK